MDVHMDPGLAYALVALAGLYLIRTWRGREVQS